MTTLRWQVMRALRALQWQGAIGIGLIVVAALIYALGIGPDKAHIAQLQQENSTVREFARNAGNAENATPRADATQLERFYSLLPEKASAPDWLGAIFSAARDQTLALDQAEYEMKFDANGRLVRYEISLPVRGTYVQVRNFISNVLDHVPAIALDALAIQRAAIGNPTIEASIRFTLFLNGG